MELANGGSSSNTQYGVEKLVGSNYKYWRMCMESYLQGQDLWELVSGNDSEIPADNPENVEPRRKWKIKCGKALFALRTSISREFIDHVRDINSPREVWEILERLFSKKNTARLQFLENELALTTQGGSSISEYFLKIKSICAEISELDTDGKVSDARLRRFLIRGLKKEYSPFITSIQGWEKQPSVEELENLLSNQEALAKQMARNIHTETDAVLFSKGKATEQDQEDEGEKRKPWESNKPFKCYRCGKPDHIKRNCRVKLSKANVACEDQEEDQINWEQCFTVAEAKEGDKMEANHAAEWILDSGCSHHVTGNNTLFSELHKHDGKRVIITADNSAYPVAKEGMVQISANEA